ncbi:phage major capsid protein [Flavonifractor sp. An135]|nr:phage major capsid protein [Flavonifractor sp. An135]OUQ22099.1 phage major capsid protein [Flavonifractor sp. An135]
MSYSFDNLRLEKGMYHETGRSFTQVLEREDPSECYKGTSLEGLDAFQRQLKRFDIKVKGAGSDVVEKFFATAQSAVLFPEYVSRSVRQGMDEANLLPYITAATTRFDGMDYRSIASVPEEEQKELRHVAEGAAIPETQVRSQNNLVRLHKRGRMLVAPYEAIRYQKLDLFSVTLRQIGAHINRMHLEDAIDVLIHGDGNENPAEEFTVGSEPIGGSAGTLTYDDLVDFWAQFDPYEMNTLLVSGDVMRQMLKMTELQNPLTGLNFQGTGTLDTPLGAKLLRTSALEAGTLIGLDRRYALEMVQGSDVLVEYDKLIDRQLERAAITSISGFAKLFVPAGKVLRLGE